jgi:CubicO group peptidase (beta-lactamase class C family)
VVLTVEVPSGLLHGDVDEGFGAVADAFRRNFTNGSEVGAACAIHLEGRKVVDLWGGYRDGRRRLPWQQDTLVSVFSATKGMAATAMAVAHSRGLFELDEPVASYWPAFAAGGKAMITVRQLLAHQAGLAVLDHRVALATAGDHDRLGSILRPDARWLLRRRGRGTATGRVPHRCARRRRRRADRAHPRLQATGDVAAPG